MRKNIQSILEINTRETFKKEFAEYNSRCYRGHIYADYCIDSQGRIQVVKPVYKKKSKRKVEFFVGTPVYYYTLNVQFLKSHPTLDFMPLSNYWDVIYTIFVKTNLKSSKEYTIKLWICCMQNLYR